MTEWRVSYSEGYSISDGSRCGYEVEAVIYPRGGDVRATFVARKQFGLAATRARLARRVEAWIAADEPTRRAMQSAELLSGTRRSQWWKLYWRDHG